MKKWIWIAIIATTVAVVTIILNKPVTEADWSWVPFFGSYLTKKHPVEEPLIKQQENKVAGAILTDNLPQNYPSAREQVGGGEKPQSVIALRVNAEQLLSHVETLAFRRYTDAERSQARKYIYQVLTTLGWSPTLQSFESGVNVLAQRPGTNPEAGTILLAAHYDTVERSPGADDNATGVATVLEVARLLGSHPTPRTLQIAFFDREEEALRGSLAFVRAGINNISVDKEVTSSQKGDLTNLRGAIILDMIGFACHTSGCQRYPEGLPVTPPSDKGDFLAVVADAEHSQLLNAFQQSKEPDLPPVLTLPIPFKGLLTPDVLRSDHAPFWYHGLGAVLVNDTANFRTPHYHQPTDKPKTIDRTFFVGAAQIVANAIISLLGN